MLFHGAHSLQAALAGLYWHLERESEREMRRRRRVDEQQNVLSAYYMPAGISGLSEDRPPFVIKQRTNPVMEQRWSH